MTKKIIILCVMLAAIPAMTLAWTIGAPLVSCGTQLHPADCTLCDIYVLAQNVVSFLMWVVTPIIATFAFSWAGFKILISGPNPSQRNEGIGIIKKTLVGVLIVFSAWIIINELLLFFAGEQRRDPLTVRIGGVLGNPWNTIDCR